MGAYGWFCVFGAVVMGLMVLAAVAEGVWDGRHS